MLNESLYSSEKMDWATPQYLFDHLHREFDFTLDACADDGNAKCKKFFTEADDGLAQEWNGRVWMNPPYGRKIALWVERAYEAARNGEAEVVVCLVPVRSDSKWRHNHCMSASEIRLLDQRIEFHGSTNKAPFPTAIVIFRHGVNAAPTLTRLKVRPIRR